MFVYGAAHALRTEQCVTFLDLWNTKCALRAASTSLCAQTPITTSYSCEAKSSIGIEMFLALVTVLAEDWQESAHVATQALRDVLMLVWFPPRLEPLWATASVG
jgi:hypothetical protein